MIACGQASGGSRVGRGSLRGITAGHKEEGVGSPAGASLGGWSSKIRVKKHVGRWMDIQQSLLLESCVH